MIVFGLGSNLKDRLENINEAISYLSDFFEIQAVSSIYQSKAVLKDNSPSSWNKDFFNCVVSANNVYNYSPLIVLEKIKQIEANMGRDMENSGLWSPRIIDIDIVLWDNDVFEQKLDGKIILKIPHPHMHKRNFVLLPLIEIMPEWLHPEKNSPAYNKTLRTLLKETGMKGIKRNIK